MRRRAKAPWLGLGVLAVIAAGVAAVQARMAPPPGPPQLTDAECKLAPVDAGHLFIAAGIMEGDTLTSLQLGDPNGRSTVVRVKIASGTQPMTLLLQSHGEPVIWDFEGTVERVQRAIVASDDRDRRVAVRGLPAERAEFPELGRCPRAVFPPWLAPNEKRDQAIELYFGRAADRAVFQASPIRLRCRRRRSRSLARKLAVS
jgi:hypothetical protein